MQYIHHLILEITWTFRIASAERKVNSEKHSGTKKIDVIWSKHRIRVVNQNFNFL